MIEGNRIELGNGDILIEVNKGYITLQNFEVTKHNINECSFKYLGEKIKIDINSTECYDAIMEKLNNTKESLTSFEFKEYIFEFDDKSTHILQCIENLQNAIFIAFKGSKFYSC